jgi:hypothetical protein
VRIDREGHSVTILAALIFATFATLAALALLGFPSRTPQQAAQHGVNLILESLQSRCTHERVTADALEGCVPDMAVKVCQRCGAYAVIYGVHSDRNTQGEWRVPMATAASAPLAQLDLEGKGAGNWTPAARVASSSTVAAMETSAIAAAQEIG